MPLEVGYASSLRASAGSGVLADATSMQFV